jgi:beta-phosphoglucomutase-like phosphatase (HAD superfamily)
MEAVIFDLDGTLLDSAAQKDVRICARQCS